VVLGKVAHIVAHSDNGPRGDPMLPARDRDRYDNLILFCGQHHDVVDGQPNTYTTQDLRAWKEDLEEWVRYSLAEEIAGIGFAEMEVVAKYIVSAPSDPEKSLQRIAPEEKMRRNGLTDNIRILLDMGFAKASEVGDFVQTVGTRDPKFPERLKAGLLTEYKRRFAMGERGDALFLGLLGYASGTSRDMLRRAAGLAVLGYFFELCEVFER
jgi:predicted house-cleaning noncanonical NTP pyrophosphatase (MazG superfamily)